MNTRLHLFAFVLLSSAGCVVAGDQEAESQDDSAVDCLKLAVTYCTVAN